MRYVNATYDHHLLIVDNEAVIVGDPGAEWIPHHAYITSYSPRVARQRERFDRLWMEALTPELIYDSSTPDDDRAAAAGIVRGLERMWGEIIADIAREPEKMHWLSPNEFERLIAELLSRRGLRVRLTPKTRDGGCDILAFLETPVGEHLYLVECKRYAPIRPVGVSFVRNLYGVVEESRATAGLLVASSRFTRGAISFRERVHPRISLKDYDDLVRWIQD